jgi:hypothetical protein
LYTPKPIDTSGVIISAELLALIERLAENAHDIWALNRMKEGWRHGPQRNDLTQKHPDLVPYSQLPDAERNYDRATVMETLKAIIKLGYEISKKKKRKVFMSNMAEMISQGLWNENVDATAYARNEKYQEHVLEQYKLYVEMADRISARRNLANTFFLTLHTAIISAVGFTYEKGPALENRYFILLPLAAILALCYTWWRMVKSYRQLNTAKYQVVGEFETRLPARPYYSAEWKAIGEGKNPKLYLPLTHVENWVPIIFGLIYIVGAVLYLYRFI